MIPTSDEVSMLKNYDGDSALLGEVEKFFIEIIKVPNLQPRLECFVVKHTFDTDMRSVKTQVYL